MMKSSKAATILLQVMLLLSMLVLTGCCHSQTTTLQGNEAKKLQQNELTPFAGWLIRDEALARILEKAERVCP